jgi:3-hydroxymyristoyl/3-hydroxydecanoyl-(acyl carrier protein) dehydratase
MATEASPDWNWLDNVVDFDLDRGTLQAQRLFRPEEWYFQVHFPGRPVVPGVILIEAMAHGLGVLGGLQGRARHGAWRHFALLIVDDIRFYRMVAPNTRVTFDARVLIDDGELLSGRVTARGPDGLVARGQIRLTSQAFEAPQDEAADPFGLQAYLSRVLPLQDLHRFGLRPNPVSEE